MIEELNNLTDSIPDPSLTSSNSLANTITYEAQRIIGYGAFGVVFEVIINNNKNKKYVIKKILQDKKFKNRELLILLYIKKNSIKKSNFLIHLKHFFFTSSSNSSTNSSSTSSSNSTSYYLNLVMDFIPETLHSIIRSYSKSSSYLSSSSSSFHGCLPPNLTKYYLYQALRGLAHLHGLGICHRDIKPHNLLINYNHELKICDFGSAKIFHPNEPNVSYICSRYYRAPELIFGSTEYDTSIDIWSLGCVFVEMILGKPLFPGPSTVDQLVEIIKILGMPSKEELRKMNSTFYEFSFPPICRFSWKSIIPKFSYHVNQYNNQRLQYIYSSSAAHNSTSAPEAIASVAPSHPSNSFSFSSTSSSSSSPNKNIGKKNLKFKERRDYEEKNERIDEVENEEEIEEEEEIGSESDNETEEVEKKEIEEEKEEKEEVGEKKEKIDEEEEIINRDYQATLHLVDLMIRYIPESRIKAIDAVFHPYFQPYFKNELIDASFMEEMKTNSLECTEDSETSSSSKSSPIPSSSSSSPIPFTSSYSFKKSPVNPRSNISISTLSSSTSITSSSTNTTSYPIKEESSIFSNETTTSTFTSSTSSTSNIFYRKSISSLIFHPPPNIPPISFYTFTPDELKLASNESMRKLNDILPEERYFK